MTNKQLSTLIYLNVASIPKLIDLLVQWNIKVETVPCCEQDLHEVIEQFVKTDLRIINETIEQETSHLQPFLEVLHELEKGVCD